ncbi:hypothetical protein PROFUN_01573 [Planoprotostelium fungivorum]|uniref:Uncharacterized protein n=1 Tax=Planoprotostelium fungivorum TaxID=1890364 RepID=A0A2P6NTN3_9EUKA|nr:hypothetical protein PROFUN_01573 [Planoprotostelium fungivorum]
MGLGLEGIAEWIEEQWQEEIHHTENRTDRVTHTIKPSNMPLIRSSQEFELLEPLRPLQRKSYDTENRFLSPKPVISLKQNSSLLGKITSVNISVVLLDERGDPLEQDEQAYLSGPCGQQTTFSTPHLRTAPMCVRVSHRLTEVKTMLCFIVDYETEDGKRSQSIVKSNCFNFIRDRRKRGVRSP